MSRLTKRMCLSITWMIIVGFYCTLIGLNLCGKVHSSKLTIGNQDFEQFYMAGMAITENMPDCLYPETTESGTALFLTGKVKEPLASILAEKGFHRWTVNIFPPPVALACMPLGLLDYKTARMLFLIASLFAIFFSLVLLDRECRDSGWNDWQRGVFLTIVGCSQPVFIPVLIGNGGVFVLLAAMLLVRGLRLQKIGMITTAMIVGALVKGHGVLWAPVILLMRRWRTFRLCILSSLLICMATAYFTGVYPFIDFIMRVSKEARLFYLTGDGNLSILSLVDAILNRNAMRVALIDIQRYSDIVMLGLAIIVYARMFLCGKTLSREESHAEVEFMAYFVLTTLFQAFSPTCWNHAVVPIVAFIPRALSLISTRLGVKWIVGLLCMFCLFWLPIGPVLKRVMNNEYLGFIRNVALMCFMGGVLVVFLRMVTPAPKK